MPKGFYVRRVRLCEADGCEERHSAHGFCKKHYRYWRKSQGIPCPIAGCIRTVAEKNLCSAHAHRAQKHGDALAPIRSHAPNGSTEEERFWFHVTKNGPVIVPELGPCSTWTAGTNEAGYGIFHLDDGTKVLAHRYVLGLKNRDGVEGCHRCDNPPCVRPEHLFRGTKSDNMKDMLAKNRGRWSQRKASVRALN